MRVPKNFWVYVKVGVLVAFFIGECFADPTPTGAGDDPPPLWLALIPAVFLGLLLPPFLRFPKSTARYLTTSPWSAFPFSPFRDPLPFYHFGMWVCFTVAVPQTYHAIKSYDAGEMFMALFAWSCAVGAWLGIAGTRRGLEEEQTKNARSKGEHAPSQDMCSEKSLR